MKIKITDIKVKALAVVMAFIIILIAIMYVQNALTPKTDPYLGDIHVHADFKVYLNGEMFNFTQEKYMSSNTSKLSQFVHLHDMDGDVIHVHMSTVNLGMFFTSLNMNLNSTCFATENQTYCNSPQGTLKVFVNGQPNYEFDTYKPKDLDRILITYGNEGPELIQYQLASVTDKACIPSEKCPERGLPEDESSCLSGQDCKA